jgi:uncharacterized membrane protein YedE/YeeE
MIGGAALLLLLFLGRIAGVSGIIFGAFTEQGLSRWWRLSFLGGLLAGGVILRVFLPEVFQEAPTELFLVPAAGLLVGFGVSLGSGCTSGHGVCGVARLSPRSLLATGCFLLVGMLVASLLYGGGV